MTNPPAVTPPAFCERCEVSDETVIRRRLNTAFVDEEKNYSTLCQSCYDEECAYWQERWNDYNREIWLGVCGA